MNSNTTPRDIGGDPRHAYRRMAAEAPYRPAAPSDGFGNITVPLADLDLAAEADRYATSWHRLEHDEGELGTVIGVPDFRDRTALIFAVEAAQCICGMAPAVAVKLLRMAADDLERRTS